MTRLAAAVLACALLAGCTSDDPPAPAATTAPATGAPSGPSATALPNDPTELVRTSPDRARAAGGATYTYVLAGRQGSGPIDRISGVGRVDLTTDTAATRGDFGIASEGRQFDVVTRGSQYWLSVPPQYRTGYVKAPWVSTTTTVARLGMSTLGHPGTYLDALRAATAMTEKGREDVRAVSTRHFTGRLDVAAFVEGLPAQLRDATRRAFTGVTQVHLEVWLDDAGRPWRVRSRTAAGGAQIESGFDVTRYGAVAAVVVPDHVAPLAHMDAVLQAVGVGQGRR